MQNDIGLFCSVWPILYKHTTADITIVIYLTISHVIIHQSFLINNSIIIANIVKWYGSFLFTSVYSTLLRAVRKLFWDFVHTFYVESLMTKVWRWEVRRREVRRREGAGRYDQLHLFITDDIKSRNKSRGTISEFF